MYFEVISSSKNFRSWCVCLYIYTTYIALSYLDFLLSFPITDISQNIIPVNLRPSHSQLYFNDYCVLKSLLLFVNLVSLQDWSKSSFSFLLKFKNKSRKHQSFSLTLLEVKFAYFKFFLDKANFSNDSKIFKNQF